MTKDKVVDELGESPDPAIQNLKALEALLPEAFSEGRLDVEALKRTLGEESIVEGGERYRLDWAGKSDAYKVLQTPTTATLRPERDKSLNFDTAQHVFIEGENLEVLKVIQKAYFGKVKLIYIDPPYNTGNDSFIYPDRFQESKDEYLKRINQLDDDGTLMREGYFRKNSKDSGYYHSNWLNMMLPRLYIARNLLRDDGVLMVSIDDNECPNLRLLIDEIFGAENFIAQLIWEKGRKNDAKLVSVGHEYILLYVKNKAHLTSNNVTWREEKPGAKEIYDEYVRLKREFGDDITSIERELRQFYDELPKGHPSKKHSRYNKVDENGVWRDDNISWPGGGGPKYDVIHPKTRKPCAVPDGGWRYSTLERMQEMIESGKVIFREDHTEPPIRKTYLVRTNDDEADEPEDSEDIGIQVAGSYFYRSALQANTALVDLFGARVFDNPKDQEVLARWISYVCQGDKDALIVDFFGGSATTTHAVLELNARDSGNRKSICVQLPEACPEDSAAFALGYRTIADVARARVCKLIERYSSDSSTQQSALGVKSFRLAPSTFKQWRGDAIENGEQLAEQISIFVKSDKDGAEVDSMLYELLLRTGQTLTSVIEPTEIGGHRVYLVNRNKQLFVLNGFSEEMIDSIVDLNPGEVIVLDSVFSESDELKTNLELQCRDAGIKFTCV